MTKTNLASPKESILIVDDKPDNLRLLSTMLEAQGYKVKKSLDGKFAIKGAQVAPPDLILLDINMPIMNGYQVCEELKKQTKTSRIPIIFISALDRTLDKVKAFKIGGADYITKPFHLEEVLARVENQLNQQRLARKLQEKNLLLEQEIEGRLRTEEALVAANRELERLANLDGLTEILNRRSFDIHLNLEWQRHLCKSSPLSLILCDVDYFKAYNDTYGHLKGDDCLRRIASCLSSMIEKADVSWGRVARYGGEEFAAILPDTNIEQAMKMATQIQKEIFSLKILHAQSQVSQFVTISLGVTTITPQAGLTVKNLISTADKALYKAKEQGRNCLFSEQLMPIY
ncbi:MAG: diguanylate cyclase [Spirulinaceae cyanobacterium]